MARRDKMASAYDTTADREPDRSQVTADQAVTPMANVPWAPAEAVYLHQDEPVADDADDIDDQDRDEPADFDDAPPRAPTRVRRAIPLLWAAALTIAALQHAGEVERRAALREPSSGEIEMQGRSEREIRPAWRNMGSVTAVAETKPVEAISVEQTAERLVAKQHIEPVAVRDVGSKPLEVERPLVEPITGVTHRTMTSDEAEGPAKTAAEQPARDDINTAAATIKASEPQAKADVARTLQPIAEDAEPAKPVRKGRVITSHAPRQPILHATEPKNARPTRAKSTKYVEFDGQGPRYFTVERPSRGSP